MRNRLLLLTIISIAIILKFVHYLHQVRSEPCPSALDGANLSTPTEEESPKEISTLAASAIVPPIWKRPLGMGFWPGLRQPPTHAAAEADLGDDAEVIGVQIEGRTRAYCIEALSGAPWYKVVNDVIAGRPVSVAYCDSTRCAGVFTATTNGAPLKLGIGGWDAEKGLMLHLEGVNYALEDGTNLTQPKGQPLPFERMQRKRTTWGQWRHAHPDTDVYVLPPVKQILRDKGFWPGIRQPLTLSAKEAQLDEDVEVIGVSLGGRARAYCVDSLSGGPEFHVINDMLADRPVTVAYCDHTRCARVFTTPVGNAPLDLNVGGWDADQGMMLNLNGVNYALKDGNNITHPEEGPLPLPCIEPKQMPWGQWRRAHPDTDVYMITPPTS